MTDIIFVLVSLDNGNVKIKNMSEPIKLNNEEFYQKLLLDYPPKYKIGDCVYTNIGYGYVTGRVFKATEKLWKYTISPHCLPNNHIDVNCVY